GLVNLARNTKPDFGRSPVLGRHSRDHILKWPSTIDSYNAVYTSPDYQTVLLGGAASLIRKFGSSTTDGKIVYGFGESTVAELLDGIDFWAYFHGDKLTESFGKAIAEAMAAGGVVILPPYLKASFGDGAIYAEPIDVANVIAEFWSDPSKYFD